MSRLQQLQRRFQDYLEHGTNAIETDIVSTDTALAEHRLGTYYNAYRIRLIDALAIDYAAVEQYLGRESFEYLVLDYLQKYPSTSPSVRWAGQHLPAYLEAHYQADDAELLCELAHWEWTQAAVFDAPDSDELVQLEDMASISPEAWSALTFELQPSVRWLDLHWNVARIDNALDNAEAMPPTERAEHPQRWLLWRRDYKTHWRSLEVHEAWALAQAQAGASFGEICEGLLEWVDAEQAGLVAAGFLKQWISDQLLARLHAG